MVSEKDREHFANIARANAEEEKRRLEEAARRSPGENIRIALGISDEWLALSGVPRREDPIFSLPARWRSLHAGPDHEPNP